MVHRELREIWEKIVLPNLPKLPVKAQLKRTWFRMRPSIPALLTALTAIGCSSPQPLVPTFNKDVAPIVFTHCSGCHRPGPPMPFTLVNYQDVKGRAGAVATATETRRMPPWLPDPGNPALVGERSLRAEDIDTVQRWVGAGSPEGDPADLPPRPTWPDAWEYGHPDLVATLPRPYMLQPGDHDVYRNVVLRLSLSSGRFVRAVEFRPGDAPIHHAVIRIDRTHTSRARDGADGQAGFDGMVAYDVQDPDGHFLGWAPGRGPIVAPEGMPWVLDRDSDLIVELHLMPGGTARAVRPSVALFFTDTPPTKHPVMIVMGSKAIDIPAGAREYAIEDRYQLPVDVEVLSVYPHAHYLGREMDVHADLPDGSTKQLIHIRQWSFQWQQDYRFVTPIALPRGTTIALKYAYDNSEANTSNPHLPPRRVTWGPRSTDEMGNLGLQLLPRNAADAPTLVKSFAAHAALIDVAGAEVLVKADPKNAGHHTRLGTSYVQVGRYADAIPSLQRALRLDPRSAQAENYLGGALLALGRGQEALVRFRRASALSPRDEHLHFNLARVLERAGYADEAAREYRLALTLNPDLAEAHQQLGGLLLARNRIGEALTHLKHAVELAPASVTAHSDFGGALAQTGRLDEAIVHVRRALELDPAYGPARQNLDRLERMKRP